jgi:hypothetical protein
MRKAYRAFPHVMPAAALRADPEAGTYGSL